MKTNKPREIVMIPTDYVTVGKVCCRIGAFNKIELPNSKSIARLIHFSNHQTGERLVGSQEFSNLTKINIHLTGKTIKPQPKKKMKKLVQLVTCLI